MVKTIGRRDACENSVSRSCGSAPAWTFPSRRTCHSRPEHNIVHTLPRGSKRASSSPSSFTSLFPLSNYKSFFLRLWRPRRIVYCSISVHYVSFLSQIFRLTLVNRCKGFPTGTLRWTAFSRPSHQRIDSSRTAFASYNAGCSGWHRFGRFGGKR